MSQDQIPSLEQLTEFAEEPPARRIVDLMLTLSPEKGVSELWLLAVRHRYQFVVVVCRDGQWEELISQTWLMMSALLDCLKHRAGLLKVRGLTQRGHFTFEREGRKQRVHLTIHPGEHMDEAHLRFSVRG